MPDFQFQHNPRHNCYDTSNEVTTSLIHQAHGGVGVYFKANRKVHTLTPQCTNLETLLFHVEDIPLTCAVVYRPSTYPLEIFCSHFKHLIDKVEEYPGTKLIMGDFNDNAFTSSSVVHLMAKHHYVQSVCYPTTEKGTLIDHVYIKDACTYIATLLQLS